LKEERILSQKIVLQSILDKSWYYGDEGSLPLTTVAYSDMPVVAVTGEKAQERYDAASERLRRLRKKIIERFGDVDVELVIAYGKPGKEIIHYGDKMNVDVIILGGKGRGKSAGRATEKISDYVVRNADCPVLVLKHRGDCS
jgi:nucleotide-binding universal stress UspA family protein